MGEEVRRLLEEERRRVGHELTLEFNEKCERYMRRFRERDEAIARLGAELAEAREGWARETSRAEELQQALARAERASLAPSVGEEERQRELARREAAWRAREAEMWVGGAGGGLWLGGGGSGLALPCG
jgi:23S rRNA pseudoU1915 N3-methylase RlmH